MHSPSTSWTEIDSGVTLNGKGSSSPKEWGRTATKLRRNSTVSRFSSSVNKTLMANRDSYYSNTYGKERHKIHQAFNIGRVAHKNPSLIS